MKNYLFFLFLSLSVICNSQSNYQRKLFQSAGTGTVSEVAYSNEYNTTTFVVENLTGPTAFTGYASLTKFTTTTGNVTSSKSFSIAGYDLAIKSVVKNNQMLYMVASLTNSTTTTGMVIKYNLSTNTSSWRKIITLNQTSSILKSIAFDNNKFIYALGGDSTIFGSGSNLFVSKLDTNGVLYWTKKISEGGLFSESPRSILYNGKREIYVSSNGTFNTTNIGITLRLDSAGTILNYNSVYSGFGFLEKFSAILKGKLVTIDKTVNSNTPGPFLIRQLDTNLTPVLTKTLNGSIDIKQVYSNNSNLLITGPAPVNQALFGFRTIRLDTLLNVSGSRYFQKIATQVNSMYNNSATCFINSTNSSFHFFRPNTNSFDTIYVIHADNFESVGCKDTIYTPTPASLTFSVMPYTFTAAVVSGTASTITMPIATLTYSSTSVCTAITTGINSVTNSEIISVFPNPVNSVLNFNLETTTQSNFKITDVTGKEVINGSTQNNIDVSGLKAGIYFLSVYDHNKQLLGIKKFMKE